tara:strand:- start:8729 stop:9868 length:1140 start_codon:yes stop_codon:yes gene_type:complete
MIDPEVYLDYLRENEINFFSGVPDSLLKHFCACVTDKCRKENHIISANEGGAVALGIGNYLGTKKIPLIYLQNSGLGNVINPLISLASPEVYGIPMILMIGWRGEPGIKDEPQHVHQGRVMNDILAAMDIPYTILSKIQDQALLQTKEIIELASKKNCPVAIIIQKNTFNEYSIDKKKTPFELGREDAVKEVVENIHEKSCIICTTGMASRELFEYRVFKNQSHQKDFLTVGGMGHANQIALGLSQTNPSRLVYCLDGDGAAIMHMGGMPIIGQSPITNLVHILLNNGVHDSVGGQPTVGFEINFCAIAKASGYQKVISIDSKKMIKEIMTEINLYDGPYFIEIKVRPGNRKDIGRPTTSPIENKESIMNFIHKENKNP